MQTKERPNLSSPEAKMVGRKLKALRTLSNLETTEVAERTGLRVSTVEAIEYGKYNAGIRQIVQIADALGYEVAFKQKAAQTMV